VTDTTTRERVLLRPLWRPFARSVTWSTVAAVAPVLLALGVLTVGTPLFAIVAACAVGTVLLAVLIGVRVRSVFLELHPDRIREGFYVGGSRTTPRSEITAVLIADVFTGSTLGSARQVLVLDAAGRTRVRVHARYWEAGTVDAIAAAFPARVARVPGPVSRREFRRAYAPHLSWPERHPVIMGTAVGLAALALLVPVFATVVALI
jgi:hypothetical protein